MIHIGIDVGKKGALVCMNGNKEILSTLPMPTFGKKNELDINSINHWLKSTKNKEGEESIMCCLEKVHAMPGQGVSSMFKFGWCAGVLEGLLVANGIPYQKVTPRTWHKEVCKDVSGDSPKDRALMACKRLFPNANLLATERSRKPHDGIVDAILLAEYSRRTF